MPWVEYVDAALLLVEYVDAALLLKDLFNDLSETRVPYAKTTHSVALTKWLIENQPQELDEIVRRLKEFLNRRPAVC